MSTTPEAEYTARLAQRREALARADITDGRVSNARLVTALAAITAAVASFGYHAIATEWTWLGLAAFVALIIVHMPVLAAKKRAARAVSFYERGLDRLNDRWRAHGRQGAEFTDPHHPYARDFDVFGQGSLFQRLATLQTRTGEETLARWLLKPPPFADSQARQAAVQELTPALDTREQLSVDAEMSPSVSVDALVTWGEAEPKPLGSTALQAALFVLATLGGCGLVAWLLFGQSPVPLFALVPFTVVTTTLLKSRALRVTQPLATVVAELKALVPVMQAIERADYTSGSLKALRARVIVDPPASEAIRRLARRVDWYDARLNQLFAPIAYLLLWQPLFAFVFERWRRAHGRRLRDWLAVSGEIEALQALAGYAFENPTHVYPELVTSGAVFEAEELRHPLLPGCVPNDVVLPRVLLVSGSNMSGKSTLLRSIGTNALLALIGAPVRATRLRMSWCSLGATLRVEDSLQEGASRFYAEVQRFKQLVDLAHDAPPLLFLLDEIMGGTNSHDRGVGTEALIRVLLARGAFGVVTTHDLALTEIATRLGAQAINVHFEDQMTDARLAFDYKMRPGVVQKSNALALMRAAGLVLDV